MHPVDPAPGAGTRTFLFTDLEGSTRLWERFPQAMRSALERHDALLEASVTAAGGQVVKTTGDGLLAVFASAADGVRACLAAQLALAAEPWPETGALRVRMGLHAGDAQRRADDYFGPAVIRAARIMAAGHGGQVLLSSATAALVSDQLPDGAGLVDLGSHRLKDLGRPERLFQLAHPGLGRDFPALATIDRRPNNLPTQASTFVGRGIELKEIRKRLEAESVRLLTLTGPGGTGKTRLALRVAADEIDRFDDGVFFVDLSPVRDTESVLASIARAIGLSEASDRSLLEELGRQLRHQRVLLVLDNFEQALAAAPATVELLSGCPGLKFLVTSREALHVRGEQQFAVPPLSLPRARAGGADPAASEAVQLFVERAQAVRPDLDLSGENAAAIEEICLRLDGLPLAIELATARVNLFSPVALRDRLGSRLALLRGGVRDLPARQRTLRNTIEWSYQLLEPAERRLFELLSAFSGAGLEAVEAVAAALDADGEVVDDLASLLDKSLVRQHEADGAEPRLVMLETIREYAAERLDEQPDFSAAVRRAHATWFADFARRQWAGLTGQGRERALAAMAADIDNLRLAWRHWVDARDLDQLNKLVDSLWLLYDARGWYHDTIQLTNDLLDVLPSTPSTPERATREATLRMSLARALMATKGYSVEVEQAYARALEPFGGREPPQLFPVLRSLASFYVAQRELDKGIRIGWQLLRLAEQHQDPGMLVEAHLVLGINRGSVEGPQVGMEHLDKAIELVRADPFSARPFRLANDPGVTCLTTAAFFLWMLGKPDTALDRAEEALALAATLQHPYSLAYAHFHAGYLHLWRGEPERVAERAASILTLLADHDFKIWRALGTCLQGVAEAMLGRPAQGLAKVTEGLARYRDLPTPPVFWPLLLSIQAATNALAGRLDEALRLIDEALAISEQGDDLGEISSFSALRGDLLAAAGTGDPEPWYQRAIDSAEGSPMLQLQGATRLCRLRIAQGRDEEGRRLLRGIYDTFTEGFTTPDLVAAKALLDS